VPVHTAARQSMEDRNGLLSEELFQFVAGHWGLVKRPNP
jgi:hypothetical protein